MLKTYVANEKGSIIFVEQNPATLQWYRVPGFWPANDAIIQRECTPEEQSWVEEHIEIEAAAYDAANAAQD